MHDADNTPRGTDLPAYDCSTAPGLETAYLLRSPENGRRLRDAIARDKAGGGESEGMN